MTKENTISDLDIEEILTQRVHRYLVADVDSAVVGAQIDQAVAIKVAPIPDGEEEINGVLIRDSAAVIDEDTRINAHVHMGGEDSSDREIRGLEVYKILAGEGIMSLGDPVKKNGEYVRDGDGNVEVDYTDHIIVKTGDVVSVKPGQIHFLLNTSSETKLKFVFTGSPDHIEPKPAKDRIMTKNPDESVVMKNARLLVRGGLKK